MRPQTSEDAQRAIHLGRGMKVNNRECRTEVARVNRRSYTRIFLSFIYMLLRFPLSLKNRWR